MTPNQKLIDQDTPTITLGGVSWPIPMFAPKQNRTIVPLVKKFVTRGLKESEDFLAGLDEDGYDDLIKMIYCALTAGHNISMAEFESMPMHTIEMTRAVDVIMRQTGIFVPDAEKKVQKITPKN